MQFCILLALPGSDLDVWEGKAQGGLPASACGSAPLCPCPQSHDGFGLSKGSWAARTDSLELALAWGHAGIEAWGPSPVPGRAREIPAGMQRQQENFRGWGGFNPSAEAEFAGGGSEPSIHGDTC